ncbi:MAG: hypothetical protein JNJ82_19695 [Opitutaceae bacterium]|jgi:hypothetical protein|nr:hypothetical protein [Opitutaceae bacterium]
MSLFLALLAVTASPAPTPTLSVSTALLLIAVGLLIFVAKAIADLRAEVQDLRERLTARPTATAEHPSPATSAAPEAIDSTLRAVIAAAVHTAMADQPYRIVAVAQTAHDAGWSLEGRRQVFQSHQVR